MRGFFSKKKSSEDNLKLSTFLLKKLGYRPNNVQLFIKAFTHKSFSNNHDGVKSNERLEYLGDRVIDLIVAQYLFEKFPNKYKSLENASFFSCLLKLKIYFLKN